MKRSKRRSAFRHRIPDWKRQFRLGRASAQTMLALAVWGCWNSKSYGETYTWIWADPQTNFDDSNNWTSLTGSGVPGQNDTARFAYGNPNGSWPVGLPQSEENQQLV